MTTATQKAIALRRMFIFSTATPVFVTLCLCLTMACQSTNTASRRGHPSQHAKVNGQRQLPFGASYRVDDEPPSALAQWSKRDTKEESRSDMPNRSAKPLDMPKKATAMEKEAKRFFELVNLARANPEKTLAGCDVCLEKACYEAVGQLIWDDELARASHFHALHLVETSCFEHRSSCALKQELELCDGHPSCACVNPKRVSCDSGTDSFDRLERIIPWTSSSRAAENLAATEGATLSGEEMMEILYWEDAANNSCERKNNRGNGHRVNILNGAYKRMGAAIYCATPPNGKIRCVGVQVLSD